MRTGSRARGSMSSTLRNKVIRAPAHVRTSDPRHANAAVDRGHLELGVATAHRALVATADEAAPHSSGREVTHDGAIQRVRAEAHARAGRDLETHAPVHAAEMEIA